MTYNIDKNLTLDTELLETDDYKICVAAIEQLRLSGMIVNSAGNCIAMADLMQHTLKEFNISSRLIECKLIMRVNLVGNKTELRYTGFNGTSLTPDFVDTHVVVITDTKIPMIIDLSITHMLSHGRVWIIERLHSDDPDVIAKISFPECSLTYAHKKTIRLLGLHQTTLLERMTSEKSIKTKISFMEKIAYALIIFTFINFCINISLLTIEFNKKVSRKAEAEQTSTILTNN
jgi:hypothetical protein